MVSQTMSIKQCTPIKRRRQKKGRTNSPNDSKDKKKSSKVQPNSRATRESTVNGEKRPWHDRCLYKCGSCSKTFLNTDMAGKHIKQDNHKKYTAVSLPMYDCKICDKSILWCRLNIKIHVFKKHSLILLKFEKKYKSQTITVASGSIKDKKKSKKSVSSSNTNSTEPFASSSEKSLWYGSRCLYQCGSCPKTFPSVSAAWSHVKKHGHKKYTVVSESQYKCKICDGLIMWGRKQIRKHVLKCHSLSIEKYGQLHEEHMDSNMSRLTEDPQANALPPLSENHAETEVPKT
jgi:hypothetical protein